MKKNFDKKMLESALTVSGVFTILVCLALFLMANDPYLIYELGKTIKSGDLPAILFALIMGIVVLFVILSATLLSIAYYRKDKVEKTKKPRKKRKRLTKKVKAENKLDKEEGKKEEELKKEEPKKEKTVTKKADSKK